MLTDLLTAGGIARCTGGVVERSVADGARGVSTDSRTLRQGDLFVALRGPRFDGHRFLAEAFRRGAWGALVERGAWSGGAGAPGPPSAAIVTVGDTTEGLGDLAACHRAALPVRVLAVTGSNGKTTTKEMAAAIASRRWRVLRNEGNLNNLIGLPLTVLRLDEGHEVAVLEMGMNHRGEIRRMAGIARPSVGVVTNVGPVHLEHLGSIGEVAAAKAELIEGLEPGGTAVLSADDPSTEKILPSVKGRKLTFGLSRDADFRAEGVRLDRDGTSFELVSPAGRGEVRTAFLGTHNVRNALAAAAAAFALGAEIEDMVEGLRRARPAAMRFTVLSFAGGIRVVNDAYNANPASMTAALESFALLEGGARRAAVLGDMRELGDEAVPAHRRLGGQAAAAGLQMLFAVGDLAGETAAGAAAAGMEEARIVTAPDASAAAGALGAWLADGDLVLLKGSRSVGLEKTIEALQREGLLRDPRGEG